MSNVVNCTQDDLDQGVVCLTRGQSIGLTLDSAAGFISLGALVIAFVWLFQKFCRVRRLIEYPMDIFLIALFLFNVIMALGRMMSIKWIQDDKVFPGSYCTAQGILDQLGETGNAMVTIVIAIHTFLTVIWGGSHFWRKLLPAYLVIGCISLFLVIFIGITVGTQTHGTQHYMAPAGFWCWIRPGSRYNAQRLVGEYVWIWSVVGISVITYIPSALVARGSISVSEDCWWKFTFRRKQDRPPDPLLINKQLMMVAYPVTYAILVLPTSIVRWISGFGNTERSLPSAAILTTECIFSLSGLSNVVLFRLTRPGLLVEPKALGVAPPHGISRRNSVMELSVPGLDLSSDTPAS